MKTATNLKPTGSETLSGIRTVTKISEYQIEMYEQEGYWNRTLGYSEIKHMLNNHGVAPSDYPLDTTNWTLFDALAFLNY